MTRAKRVLEADFIAGIWKSFGALVDGSRLRPWSSLAVFGEFSSGAASIGDWRKPNSLAFCTSCHEMRDTVYQEYKQTIHYQNPFGVRAICSDCHVPHPWPLLIQRKIQASNELWHKLLGTIDTPAKFEQHRLALAEDVWASMKASNSRECRNCHTEDAMDIHKMSDAAQKVMMPRTTGRIDLHRLPQRYRAPPAENA